MNNLKFRAWHKERKEYVRVSQIDLDEKVVWLFDENINDFSWSPFNELTLEQYTGLKDKNGKDIYVGDILKITLENTREIIFHLRDYKEFITESIYSAYYEFEVIGNIHENKELLD